MDNFEFRILELSLQGFGCSQILAILAMEAQGKENPDLVRAMTGLLGGLGCGKTCGALTGGTCVLSLYAGRGSADELPRDNLPLLISELVEWFEEEIGECYGGIDCEDIIHHDPALRISRCPGIVTETFRKIVEILEAHDYSLQVPPTGDAHGT